MCALVSGFWGQAPPLKITCRLCSRDVAHAIAQLLGVTLHGTKLLLLAWTHSLSMSWVAVSYHSTSLASVLFVLRTLYNNEEQEKEEL